MPPRTTHRSPPAHTLTRRRALQGAVGGSVGLAGALGSQTSLAAPPPRVPVQAASHPVRLRVDATATGRPARPQLLGSNTPWVYGSEGLMDARGQWLPHMIRRARELAPTLLRYPGVPDTHDWRQGIGPLASRSPVFAYPGQPHQTIVYGTQEFLETCETVGAEPMIQLNLHDGDDATLARLAAAWVTHVNQGTLVSRITGRPLPKVRWWELGNEPYLMEATEADGRPNRLMLTPEAYARRVNAVMAAARAVDPTLKFGLPFAIDTHSGQPWRNGGDEMANVVGPQLGFARRVLGKLQRPQDIGWLSLHCYMPQLNDPQDAQGRPLPLPDARSLFWATVAGSETWRHSLGRAVRLWRDHASTRHLPAPPIAVTEYNAFYSTRRINGQDEPENTWVTTLTGALYVADLLRMMSELPEVGAALHWSLNGNWVFGALAATPVGAPERERPAAGALRLAAQVLREGRLLDCGVQVATTGAVNKRVGFCAPWPDMPLASAMASRNGQTLQVLVIHKDPDRDADVSLQLDHAQVRGAQLKTLQADAAFDAPETARASRLSQRDWQPASGDVTWRMPPGSIALLTLTLA